ncbi:MAG: outer membrane lipoprotein carrier protein LolA [Chloracidobacterium sp.]|nr:outer membrane lipoprotein carrier protein LolA [Chloracidobacterium sp.]
MKVLIPKLFTMAVFAAAFITLGVADSYGQVNRIREIKSRMDEHNKNLTTLRARVTMVKRNNQLNDSETTIGTAIYAKRPGKDALVRIDWERPEESLAVIDGQYTMFRPRLQVAYKGSVKDATKPKGDKTTSNSALAFMNMSKAQLDANYEVALLAENVRLSSGVVTFHLQLTPKARTSYKSAELWVDKDGMPQQTKIIEHNNDSTTVLLTNLEKNVSLKKSNFELSLPRGTKIQKS